MNSRLRTLMDKGNCISKITQPRMSTLRRAIGNIGTDKYIRIWDYRDNRIVQSSNMCCKYLLNDIAFHPIGHQLAVGTNEGILIYYTLDENFSLAADILGKRCLILKYSNGGNWLAGGLDYQICLIDPNTFEMKFILSAHKSFITILAWTSNDYYLCSACKSGTAFVWSSHFEFYSFDFLKLQME